MPRKPYIYRGIRKANDLFSSLMPRKPYIFIRGIRKARIIGNSFSYAYIIVNRIDLIKGPS